MLCLMNEDTWKIHEQGRETPLEDLREEENDLWTAKEQRRRGRTWFLGHARLFRRTCPSRIYTLRAWPVQFCAYRDHPSLKATPWKT